MERGHPMDDPAFFCKLCLPTCKLCQTACVSAMRLLYWNCVERWKERGAGMKVKLSVSTERYDEIRKMLAAAGIEVTEVADLILSEANHFAETLLVRDPATGEHIVLPVKDIVFIESFGRNIEVQTEENRYQAAERLYQLAGQLDPEKFLRVSNSVVIAREKVKSISPTLSMKFILTMAEGSKIDVTRTYYYIFKEQFGI